ncbi:DNA replication complex GINS protein PSF2 [Rutidosis leptorrhynchoides]|uniref:DNA replication complex GINS protein PSF2 n=1 Tax=Rutidosis leptorrhynchoides TaxID=125765 RepID=UPI003A9955F7
MAGQSDPHGSIFSAAELEFLAEDETIEIIPNLKMDGLGLICGEFGPFQPSVPTEVPIWLAVALKRRNKCTIRPPDWMSVEKLTQVLEAERDAASTFEPLPFHYVEISRLLFDHARDDIPEVYMVRSLIEDIKDVRFHKIGMGLEKITALTYAMKLNISAMEVNLIRPFITGGLETFYKLGGPGMIQETERQEYRRPQAADRGPRRELRR